MRLANLMQESLEMEDYLFPSELFKKLNFNKFDISFLMNCAMIYKMPLIMDNRPENNLPISHNEIERRVTLDMYFQFKEAQRILLAFCTYTALSTNTGRTRI